MSDLITSRHYGVCDLCDEQIFPGDRVLIDTDEPMIMTCELCVEEEGL